MSKSTPYIPPKDPFTHEKVNVEQEMLRPLDERQLFGREPSILSPTLNSSQIGSGEFGNGLPESARQATAMPFVATVAMRQVGRR